MDFTTLFREGQHRRLDAELIDGWLAPKVAIDSALSLDLDGATKAGAMEYIPTSPKVLFGSNCCVMIPKYQRKYSWGVSRAHSLIRDVAEIATAGSEESHWTGVVIYREVVKTTQKCALGQEDMNHICREIIDGQQRLATILIWIQALIDHQALNNPANLIKYFLPPFYLQHPNDVEFKAIVDGIDVSRHRDLIAQNYTYFRYLLWHGEGALVVPDALPTPKRRRNDEGLHLFWDRWMENSRNEEEWIPRSAQPDVKKLLEMTIGNISFLGIKIADEEPEKVFSALNGNRTELTQFDHLRNFVFSTVGVADRDSLFDGFWKAAEDSLEDLQVSTGLGHDSLKAKFLYDYLISIGEGQYGRFNQSSSFASFTKFYRSNRFAQQGFRTIEDWLENAFPSESSLWCIQREKFLETSIPNGLSIELSAKSRRTLQRIRLGSDGPPTPLVMWILRRSLLSNEDKKRFSPSDVESALSMLEAFIYKSLLAGQSLTNFRAEVIRSMSKLDRDSENGEGKNVLDPLRHKLMEISPVTWSHLRPELENQHLRELDSERGVYNMLKARATLGVLDAIDEAESGPGSRGFMSRNFAFNEDDFWIEHIFPSSASKHWKRPLSDAGIPFEDMEKRLHVLGNLTALPSEVNRDISNRYFDVKVEAVNSVPEARASTLQSWLSSSSWTPETIDFRTHELVQRLMKFWPDL